VFNFKILSLIRKNRRNLILRLLIQEPILVSILVHCSNLIGYSSFSVSSEAYQPLQLTDAKEQNSYETIHKTGPQDYEEVVTMEVLYEVPNPST